jgi:hypothetical protein
MATVYGKILRGNSAHSDGQTGSPSRQGLINMHDTYNSSSQISQQFAEHHISFRNTMVLSNIIVMTDP